jgi:dTDP-4-dehydrorhamnose reductase
MTFSQPILTPDTRPTGSDPARDIEIWAGLEYTVNRVGDCYFDQLVLSGHDRRLDDLERFAALGITALRYPVLWERIAPHGLERAEWRWADERLARLRDLGLRPIVGLVHHGSGPHGTSLADPGFADGLARFAAAVAERYPWVDAYTPVNEPLTTARFSGLYGHWYPHGRDSRTFAQALIVQCRAIQGAMRAIRERVPGAQLIQTEDIGKTYSTPALAHQAVFDNHRRWLSLDLLCGRVDRSHVMWRHLIENGVNEADLEALAAEPYPPDVMGFNHYLTSERFLDENLAPYPPSTHGGNARERYADVEAARVCPEGTLGPAALLREAWERYGRPLAFSEVHAGGPREEQLRWLSEVWDSAVYLRRTGVALRAVTVWSLLGAYNWHCLVTRDDDHYEPGVFDLRGAEPRPTLLARAVRSLAEERRLDHPLLAVPGWWRRPERLLYPPRPRGDDPAATWSLPDEALTRAPQQPIAIVGGGASLAQAFARLCGLRRLPHVVVAWPEVQSVGIERMLDDLRPWALVNAAGYRLIDQAEREPAVCWRLNTVAPARLAEACAQREVALLTFSSDQVFDGRQSTPYQESSPAAPLNIYGSTQAAGEAVVLQAWPAALIVRTGPPLGPWDADNFLFQALRALAAGQRLRAAQDVIVSPVYLPDLVHTCLDLLMDGEQGLWHLANPGALAWSELARRGAELAGLPTDSLVPTPAAELGWLARRPAYAALASERATLLPPLESALERFVSENELQWAEAALSLAETRPT